MEMGPGLDILALQQMLGGNDDEDDQHVYGSALNPSTLHGKQDKEIAKPNTKVEVKTYNRAIGGGATQESIDQDKLKKKAEDPKNQIWTKQEVAEKAEEVVDDRATPEYEIMHLQEVGTQDVFFNLQDKDPSTNHADAILVKIWLPNTMFKNVSLDI